MIELFRTGIAGEYRGRIQGAALVLRIDVGAEDSLDIVSGELLVEDGPGGFRIHHSFQSTGVVVEHGPNLQRLRSAVKVFRKDILQDARMDVEIPDEGSLTASYTFLRQGDFGRQAVGNFTFTLEKTSSFFRRVELEVDRIRGVALPEAFETASHHQTPSSVPAQSLTFDGAFRAAGVELPLEMGASELPLNLAGADGRWTDEELHAAMVTHFSRYREAAQWRLYLLLATRYVSPGVLGIMYDSGDEAPRQGAAVFAQHPAIARARPKEREREYLFTIVHELGHAFNLLHSFQKGIDSAQGILPRPASLSWMNYPQLFPFGTAGPGDWDGSGSFWSQFPFVFDREELAHLRHNDAMEVMMGGHDFGFGGHLEERPFEAASRHEGIALDLWLPPVVEFLQQLEGDVRLSNRGEETLRVHSSLHPSEGHLELLIRRPVDRFPRLYRHFALACSRAELVELPPGEAVYQELTPSFGQRHWFVDEPGTYEVQAAYKLPDGRRLISERRRLRVLFPQGEEEERAAPDFFDNRTGIYLGVEGSRADLLAPTRERLEELCQGLRGRAVARQVSLVNAVRDSRVFKSVAAGKVLSGDRRKGARELLKVLGVTSRSSTVKVQGDDSNLRLNRFLRCAARGLAAEGDETGVERTLKALGSLLKKVDAPKKEHSRLRSFARRLKSGED